MNRTLFLLVSFAAASPAEAPSAFAIRDARVVTVSGPTLERGAVLIRDGVIQAVGEAIAMPSDAWIIEGRGLTVYPGLIDALSTWGIPEPAPASSGRTPPPGAPPPTPTLTPARGPEDRPFNSSWLRAADLISTADRRIEDARAAGFTTAVVFPTRGIFAGQGAAVNLAGEQPGRMVVSAPAGLYLSLATAGFSSYPGSLMGVLAYIRQVFLDAEHYRTARETYARQPRGLKRPPYDRALEGVVESPRALLPASRLVEIGRMLRFAAELNKPAVLYGVHEGYRAADLLRGSGVPVLISLRWPERDREAEPEQADSLRVLEMRDRAPSTPGVLARAGVRFAFYSDGLGPRDLRKALKRAIDAGLPPEAAIRALTLEAAAIFGLEDRLGSIEPGKIANLTVADGDLFQEKTRIRCVFIDGAKFEPLPEAPAAEVAE